MKVPLLLLLTLFISCGKSPLFDQDTDTESRANTLAVSPSYGLKWDEDIQFGFKWEKVPVVGPESKLTIKFWNNKTGHFLGPYQKLESSLCVFLWMKMPDGGEHGSAPVVIHQQNDYYSIDEIYFIMPGTWKVYIRTVKAVSDCRNDPADPYLKEYQFEITPH